MQRFLFLTLIVALAGSASAAAAVRVQVPYGLTAGIASTTDGPDPDHQYVTIPSILVVNPSRQQGQTFTPQEFHLLAPGGPYEPVVRPNLAAIDLREPTVLGPGQRATVTVTFLVPVGVTGAKLEFMPGWYDDAGGRVDYCCLYY